MVLQIGSEFVGLLGFLWKEWSKAETPVLWPPHAKSWLIGKDSDAGRDWGQEEKGTTEDEMAGWHLWLDGRESEWTPGVGDGQGGLVCCDSWGRKESDTTERLIWSDLIWGRAQCFWGVSAAHTQICTQKNSTSGVINLLTIFGENSQRFIRSLFHSFISVKDWDKGYNWVGLWEIHEIARPLPS